MMMNDYYLMKVSKVPFQLERVENDDWGNTFPVGANVVKGYYYNRRKQNHLNMNLFEEGFSLFSSYSVHYTIRILSPVTPSRFVNMCMKIFLKAWNHKVKDLIWNVICFFFLLFFMHDVLFTTA